MEPKPQNKFIPQPLMPTSMMAQPSLAPAEAQEFMAQALEKAKKRAELSARIAARLPGAIGDVTTRPKPIQVDARGRAVDATTGKPLAMIGRQPELKANLRDLKTETAEVTLSLPFSCAYSGGPISRSGQRTTRRWRRRRRRR